MRWFKRKYKKKQLENYRFNNDDYDILKEAIFTTFLEENDIVYDNDYISEGANIDSLTAFRSGKKKSKLYEIIYDYSSDAIAEGVNANTREYFKIAKSSYKVHTSHAKKYLKAKEYAKAKKEIQEAKKSLGKIRQAIHEEKETFGSKLLGNVIFLFQMIIGQQLAMFAVTLGISSVKALKEMLIDKKDTIIISVGENLGQTLAGNVIGTMITLIDNHKVLASALKECNNTPNLSKVRINTYMDNIEDGLDKLEKLIDAKQKAAR